MLNSIKEQAKKYIEKNGINSFAGSIAEMVVGPQDHSKINWAKINKNTKHAQVFSSKAV